MNLIIFTPANTGSAIGRMAALVTHELVAQGCRVTVVRTEVKPLLTTNTHDFGTLIIPWNDEALVLELILNADAIIYHIGDNFDFHEGGVRWLADFPGLVCLHDFFLGHLFYCWAEKYRSPAQTVLEHWYGIEAAGQFFGFPDGESFIEGTREITPMTEWICSQADGVITHSHWGCDRVLNSCSGPVRVVPLAYDAPIRAANASDTASAEAITLKLLTIGNVNSNKRVSSVIQAIGRSHLLKQRVTYRLVGAVSPDMKTTLTELAAQLGVKLLISGQVDDEKLEYVITESDVISSLRWPALEAASASAIEAMLYGKAVMVTDTGFYAEIPDPCVIKIKQTDEIGHIQSSLEALLEDQDRILCIGTEAQHWASQTFTAQNYAEQLIDAISHISRTTPAKNAINNFCKILQGWSTDGLLLSTDELIHPLHIFESINQEMATKEGPENC
ncbi:glycosyltransferase [Hydrogenophaga taeniospiralis]|uniref:glycosyltransferase n=1 Tax=Hydrogenophaga taeniospiralis TaxID=65656 RepID=UPI000A077CE5|nr:glycosyltransferase [Hydrogenophaga taeniospiralis]